MGNIHPMQHKLQHWNRGPAPDDQPSMIKPSAQKALKVPEAINIIKPIYIIKGTAEPTPAKTKLEWLNKNIEECATALKAQGQCFAFILIWQSQHPKA